MGSESFRLAWVVPPLPVLLSAVLVTGVLLWSARARGEGRPFVPVAELSSADRELAHGLMDTGDAKMAAGDAQGALTAYRAADDIVGVPTTGIEVGRAQAALGLLVEARDTWVRVATYPQVVDEPVPFTRARAAAERLAAELGRRIPTLIVEVDRPLLAGLRVWLDERALADHDLGAALRVNPGRHRLHASAPGYHARELEVQLAERSERHVQLSLQPELPSPSSLQSSPPTEWNPTAPRARSTTAMWTGFTVAAVGAAVGTATGIWAYERTALAQEQCVGTACSPAASADIDQARMAGTISTVAFVVGGAGLALGIWQAVTLGTTPRTASRSAPPAGLAVFPTGSGAHLIWRGSFR